MLQFDANFVETEKVFTGLTSNRLLEVIREIESEAEACKHESPSEALKLLRACIVATRILRERLDLGCNMQ